MGRPRKRRREEKDDSMSGNLGALGELGSEGTSNTAVQDRRPLVFPSDGLVQGEFQSSNGAFDANGWLTPGELGSSTVGNGGFDFRITETPAMDSDLGLSAWGDVQSMGDAFSVPTQLHTPPTTLDYDVPDGNVILPDLQNTCSCLPDLYGALASFQSFPTPSFPFSMGTLKKASRLAHNVVQCQVCPQLYNTAVQNAMLLGTLMQMLINEYAKLLKHIDEKSSNGEKIPFRVGEPPSPFDMRHTGGPDCPMSISIDLSGDEWRLLARKAVHQEIHGAEGAVAIVQQMRNRQEEWHKRFAFEVHAPGHSHNDEEVGKAGEHTCVQVNYIDNLKKALEMLRV